MSISITQTRPALRRTAAIRLAAVAAAVLAAALPAPARAATETVLQDDGVLLHSTDDGVRQAMQEIRSLGVDRIRVTAGWSVIAPAALADAPPAGFDASDPASYPRGHWDDLDRAVRLATAAGLKVDIDIAFWAPRWASGPQDAQPDQMRTGIDPAQYAQFAHAVALRYSGSYVDPPAAGQPPALSVPGAPAVPAPDPSPDPSPDRSSGPDPAASRSSSSGLAPIATLLAPPQSAQPSPSPPPPAAVIPKPRGDDAQARVPLPHVDMFTIWNEPNHPGFLLPQWQHGASGWIASSADTYRLMVQAAYPAIKAVNPDTTVLIGGTASMGSSTPGRGGIPPLAFLRRLACVDASLRPIRTGSCATFTPLPGDGWAHHPYSIHTLPDVQPRNPDNLPVAATDRLVSTLQRLARNGRISAADTRVYMTEYGYATNPPDPSMPFSPQQQPGLLAWGEYLALRNPAVRMWPQFLLRDVGTAEAFRLGRPIAESLTGLFYSDGTAKPSAAVFRTPTFATCVRIHGRRWTLLWGRLRGAVAAPPAQPQLSSGSASWRAAVGARAPQGTTARASAVAGGGVTRLLPWQAGARYRLVWGGSGDPVVGPDVTPLGCTRGRHRLAGGSGVIAIPRNAAPGPRPNAGR